MLDEFFGLPLHPLVVHLTVVLVPTTAVVAVVFAVVEQWRWALRWLLGAMVLGSLASTGLSLLAGEAFLASRPELAPLVAEHQAAGKTLLWFVVMFTVATLVAVATLGGPSPMVSGAGGRRGVPKGARVGIGSLLVVMALLCLYQVIRTGDLGARAVWGG